MGIVEMLKNEDSMCRVTCGSRWLTWRGESREWVVCEQKPYAKKVRVVARTGDEGLAVATLLAETD